MSCSRGGGAAGKRCIPRHPQNAALPSPEEEGGWVPATPAAPAVTVTGSAPGALGERGQREGAPPVWLESAKIRQESRVGSWWDGAGDFASVGRSGCGEFRVDPRLVQTPFPSDFPGGAWRGLATGWSGWRLFCSLPNWWDPGRGWGPSLAGFGGRQGCAGEDGCACQGSKTGGSTGRPGALAGGFPGPHSPWLCLPGLHEQNWLWVGFGCF